MKTWIKKYWAWLVITIVLIVGGPIIINELYKTGKGYTTLWGAAEVLSYYGMILAALGAAAGVFFSIKYSHKQYKEDCRNRVLPYITISTLKQSAKYNLFEIDDSQPQQEDFGYREYRIENIFFIISEDKIEVKNKLDSQQQYLLEHLGKVKAPIQNGFAYGIKDMVSIPLEVENVGNGTAVGFRAGFNRVNDEKKYLLPQFLKQGQGIYIHIFSSTPYDKISGDYTLEFYYEDIYGTKYKQQYSVIVGIDKERGAYNSISLYGKQEMIRQEQEATK